MGMSSEGYDGEAGAVEPIVRAFFGADMSRYFSPANAADMAVAAELAARRQAKEDELHQAERDRKLAQIDALGADKMADGTVVKFSKRLTLGGHAYTYAAVRYDGCWYTTGPTGKKMTHDAFCAWLVSGEPDSLVDFNEMVPKVS
jgi:hypothetical protein